MFIAAVNSTPAYSIAHASQMLQGPAQLTQTKIPQNAHLVRKDFSVALKSFPMFGNGAFVKTRSYPHQRSCTIVMQWTMIAMARSIISQAQTNRCGGLAEMTAGVISQYAKINAGVHVKAKRSAITNKMIIATARLTKRIAWISDYT
jgi:hypothetical protein